MVEYEEEISITELPTIDGLVGVFFQTKNVIYIYIFIRDLKIYMQNHRIFASRKFPKAVALTAKNDVPVPCAI